MTDDGLVRLGKYERTSLPEDPSRQDEPPPPENGGIQLGWRAHPIWGNRDDPRFDFEFYSARGAFEIPNLRH